ncbi:MAG TPA: UbiA family prenyltransferase [Solirubrobacteraceae bacterium]|nr:UbiA family prenyltransferase [Solirubrobacteraceae bacterium]
MSSADALTAGAAPRWRAWLQLARVSNTPTVVSNAVAGGAVASIASPPGVPAGTVAVVAVAMALFYTAGMILNDVADLELDRVERPERPLPSGAVTRGAALVAVYALTGAGLAALAATGIEPLLAGIALAALIVLYDLWHKGNPLSPVLMAGCRALVYVIAALAVAGSLSAELWGAAALLLVYVIGLTQVAKAERSGDERAARGRSGGIAARWPVLAVLAPAAYWAKELPALEVALLLAGFLAWTAFALWLVLAHRQIGAGVVRLIAGIAVYDALVVAASGGGAVAVAVCLAAFAATVALQTKIAGT